MTVSPIDSVIAQLHSNLSTLEKFENFIERATNGRYDNDMQVENQEEVKDNADLLMAARGALVYHVFARAAQLLMTEGELADLVEDVEEPPGDEDDGKN